MVVSMTVYVSQKSIENNVAENMRLKKKYMAEMSALKTPSFK